MKMFYLVYNIFCTQMQVKNGIIYTSFTET
jgi:hypothetical protein